MPKLLKSLISLVSKQYASIGGQAVIEGVMMRSPNAFVVAIRKTNGEIRLRKDQWFGLSQKFRLFKKPFFRGVIMLIEAMANGIVALNYSAQLSLEEELKSRDKTSHKSKPARKDKIDWTTFLTIIVSFVFGMVLFVLVPHATTEGINQFFVFNWALDGFLFHLVDGGVKACIFVIYIWLIGFIPEISRVFQYHGAEHKSIATFEAGEELTVENASLHSTLHPRCGTSFIFFLLFISIILFSAIFSVIPIGEGLSKFPKHLVAILAKIVFMIPIASISYEIIKFAGKYPKNSVCRALSFPGMMLQRLTTKEPDTKQLEVALSSIKAVLLLEEKYELKECKQKVLTLEEVDLSSLNEIEKSNSSLKDFME
ncbi:MAG: metal-dependent enzyme [Halobacteriovoraceae bacterium]|nr:metal-dependent enzyme [Halobacteriovoraceae bacterium]